MQNLRIGFYRFKRYFHQRRQSLPLKDSSQKKLVWIISVWFFALFFCEIFIFQRAIGACRYSDIEDSQRFTTSRMVIVADPQLTDCYSYDYAPRGSLLLPIIQFYSDLYMRKCFGLVQSYHSPDAVVLLGDLFDGAKILSKEEYEKEYERFNWVFERRAGSHYRLYNVSGNHDIGFRLGTFQSTLAQRFEK